MKYALAAMMGVNAMIWLIIFVLNQQLKQIQSESNACDAPTEICDY